MKVSLNFVSKFVDLDGLTPEEIAHRLTFAGVEVESIEKLAQGSKLVVGEVLTCENMPDSDHLHLTTVNCGPKYGALHIVCGAPNMRKGLKVIVATDGAKLPGGTINKGKIRGYESEGMCCSLLELGVDGKYLKEEQTKGIEELPSGTEVGREDVLHLLGLDDTVLDLKLLANRSDMYAVLNVAKEIETLFGRKASLPSVEVKENSKEVCPVSSETPRCSQFSSRVVKGIVTKESPKWMKDILMASGIRSINNIVDIGNYIMLLTGQPLHMYDLDKLPKKELVVKDNCPGEFVALDEKSYALQDGDVCITSNGKVMCLGGVMGALECAVDENTKNIVIEAANFDYASIRRTSIRLNLSSDSSQRFVKGINPNQYNYVMDLTTDLLLSLADAKEVGPVTTYLEKKYEEKVIESSYEFINKRLGTSFNNEEIKKALESAFIKVEEKGDKIVCHIPASRIDIGEAADLSEEVIRILGFEHIESKLPFVQVSLGGLEPDLQNKRSVRSYLRGVGLDEIISYSLIREKEVRSFAILNKAEPYKVMNPLTDEHEYVRTNLLPSVLNTLLYNKNHGNNDLAIFEVSDIYGQNQKKQIHLAIALSGNDLRHQYVSGEEYNFYHMKGLVEQVLGLYHIDGKRAQFERANEKEFHPGKSAVVKVDGRVIAIFGELHPSVSKEYGFGKDKVIALEMDLAAVFATKTSPVTMEQISRYPTVSRDFAFVLANNVTSKEVISEIRKVDKTLIRDVNVFDVYHGEHIDEGFYSLALSVSIGSFEKTLNDQELSAVEEKIKQAVIVKFGAKLRQ